HEIGNHSLSHRYDLSRCDRETMRREVEGGAAAIARATGLRPQGFRAPGYTMSDALADVLAEAGIGWDSSVFPCPAYWAAKTAAIGLIALRGRESRSIADHPLVLSAPANPYRLGRPYWQRGSGMLEMPIGVTRGARFPFIGTSLVLGGPTLSRSLASMVVGRPVVVLELHGIDLSDARRDGLEHLAPHQPDLRVTLSRKLDAIDAAIVRLRDAGYSFVTHSEAAERSGWSRVTGG
ncbi:MAG: polysaccharide deacetylase family protein, partial [Deltaproteobacteria bacterium]|nr:polysaccharide deacetylase family protein [Deltaproteobacteria bacterium]